MVLVLFMSLPLFDATVYPHGDLFSGTLPQQDGGDHNGPMDHGGSRNGPMDHRGGPHRTDGSGEGHTGLMDDGESHTASFTLSPDEIQDRIQRRSYMRQFSVATGYIALGFLGLTLLIGPANLLLRRRNPVSSYLRRDVGTWTAIASVAHVIFGLQVHGGGQISDFLNYFVTPNGGPWLNSFGLGNWTGLAALVIVVGLLALSSDAALRKLKARPWKSLQRLNYALFALVILHAFFYGALLRVTSPFTLLLGLSVIAVFVGQAVGVWLWRRTYSSTTGKY
ncbi:MAG: ferric reductase-like transmembrane domain-containing protein [Gemmatimonadetes bacterium]|nr:ferric reductase-like transmembrane domain-containing protein [Gemmatimonadota bacterium]